MKDGARLPHLLGVLLVALVVRLVAHGEFADAPDTFAPLVDSEAYMLQALRVAQGRDLVDGVYFQAPLYPWVLGLTYRAAGVGTDLPAWDVERASELPPDVVAAARRAGTRLNLVLGLLVVALVWRVGERLFGPAAGVAAGLLASLHGPSIFYEGHLLKVTLSLVFLPWAVLAAVRAARRGGAAPWIWCGLALGLGGLVRGNLHLLTPLAALALLVAGLKARRPVPALLSCVALFAGLALALAPVVARNSVVAGRPVLSTAAGGTAFWLCNHAGNSTGLVEHTHLNRQVPLHEIEDWTARTEAALGREVTPAEISSYWMGRALDDIAADPGRWLLVELRKLGLLCSRYEAPDNASWELGQEASAVLAWTPVRYGTLLPLALGGALLAWSWRRRREGAGAGRTALVLALAGYAATLLLFNISSRFRMPVVVPLFVSAGVLLAGLRALAAREVRTSTRVAAAVAVLAGLLLTRASEGPLGPLTEVELASHRVTRLHNRALVALDRGAIDTADEDLQRALGIGRGVGKVAPDVLVSLGSLDRAAGLEAADAGRAEEAAAKRASAETAARLALRAQPAHAGAHRLHGMLAYDVGAWDEAAAAFQEALAATPLDRSARQYAALALLRAGRAEEALGAAERLVAHRPRHDDGHGLLALAAWAAGDADRAREALARYDALVVEARAAGAGVRLDEQPEFATIREGRRFFERVDPGFGAIVCGGEDADTILEVNGGGVALFDGDDDGDLDVLLVSPGAFPAPGAVVGGTNRLYRNDGDWEFTDVTAGSGVDVAAYCNGVAVGDVDADGRRDIYLTCLGENVLLLNRGDLRFERAPDAAGAAGRADEWSTSAVFTDVDRDGDADLYVVNYLAFDPADPPRDGHDGRRCRWKGMPVMCGPQGLPVQGDRYFRNDGGRFTDATASAGFDVEPGFGLGVLDGDFDGDGNADLYVSNDSTPNFLFLGRGAGAVEESGLFSGAALSSRGREQAGMGIAAGDLDGDLDEDLLVTNFSMEPNALYRNAGDGRFEDDADPSGLGGPSRTLLGWGAAFVDVDLDGDLDVVTANGHVYRQADAPGTDTSYAQPDRLWLNDGDDGFRLVDWPGDAPAVSRALAAGDLDDDGLPDLVVTRRSGPPIVWRGVGAGRATATLRVRLDGPPGDPDALGAVVRWTDGSGERARRVRVSAGFQACGDPRPVFAWRGPGELAVTLPDGRAFTRRVDGPGALALDTTTGTWTALVVATSTQGAATGRAAEARSREATSGSPTGTPGGAPDPGPASTSPRTPSAPATAALDAPLAGEDLDRLRAALDAMRAGLPERVHDLLGPLLEREPVHADVAFVAGSAASDLQEYGEAVELLSTAVARDPKYLPNASALGFAHRRLGDFDAARDVFARITAADPSKHKAHYGLGLVALDVGDLPAARAALTESLRLAPGYLKAEYALARLLEREGRLPEALETVTDVVERWPSHDEALYLQGRLLTALGRTDEATAAFERQRAVYAVKESLAGLASALGTPADGPALRLRMAELQLGIGDVGEARRALRAGLALFPDDAGLREAWLRLAAQPAGDEDDRDDDT